MREPGVEYPDVRLLRAVEARYPGRAFHAVLVRSLAYSRIEVRMSAMAHDYGTGRPVHMAFTVDVIDITEIDQFAAAWDKYVGGPISTSRKEPGQA